MTPEPSTMMGKFFHVLYPDEHRVNKQGVVEADYGFALRVRYFSWLGGDSSFYWQLVAKADITNDRWCWYDSHEEMIDAYEHAGFAREKKMVL